MSRRLPQPRPAQALADRRDPRHRPGQLPAHLPERPRDGGGGRRPALPGAHVRRPGAASGQDAGRTGRPAAGRDPPHDVLARCDRVRGGGPRRLPAGRPSASPAERGGGARSHHGGRGDRGLQGPPARVLVRRLAHHRARWQRRSGPPHRGGRRRVRAGGGLGALAIRGAGSPPPPSGGPRFGVWNPRAPAVGGIAERARPGDARHRCLRLAGQLVRRVRSQLAAAPECRDRPPLDGSRIRRAGPALAGGGGRIRA